MENSCFYCDYSIDSGIPHFISFFKGGIEHEKPLCDICYSEWLEGIKE